VKLLISHTQLDILDIRTWLSDTQFQTQPRVMRNEFSNTYTIILLEFNDETSLSKVRIVYRQCLGIPPLFSLQLVDARLGNFTFFVNLFGNKKRSVPLKTFFRNLKFFLRLLILIQYLFPKTKMTILGTVFVSISHFVINLLLSKKEI
jgi:hypothetical protein